MNPKKINVGGRSLGYRLMLQVNNHDFSNHQFDGVDEKGMSELDSGDVFVIEQSSKVEPNYWLRAKEIFFEHSKQRWVVIADPVEPQ